MQGLISLVLNILLSGMGSVLAGLVANDWATVVIGIIQFFLWPTLLGWIWSIWYGSSLPSAQCFLRFDSCSLEEAYRFSQLDLVLYFH